MMPITDNIKKYWTRDHVELEPLEPSVIGTPSKALTNDVSKYSRNLQQKRNLIHKIVVFTAPNTFYGPLLSQRRCHEHVL